ncbi:MAG: ketopantoate reductase family protein [Oribacterium sp.]|nr:ketopantoate reductase family protein [Oribacterium sp.]MDY6315880.1 ketopantoate reductase family protein [Oribacterium sp.]
MKIAVIGAGAMGSIYGGHLSLHHEVYLIDRNQTVVDTINEKGLTLQEDGEDHLYHPKAVISSQGISDVDLIILFVKALFSRDALRENQNLIGKDTYVLTLQNGSGHEDILSEFVPEDHIVIGTTEDNGAVLEPAHVRHGGVGNTNIGMLVEDVQEELPRLKEAFDACGFRTHVHDNIQQLIWNKLFTNVSLSAVTAVLQTKMGFIASDVYALNMTKMLLHEAVTVAHALGLSADEDELLKEITKVSSGSPEGITSIAMDLHRARRTEVETISGSVVRAAKKTGVPVPCHEFLVNMVHAMEDRNLQENQKI